MDFHLTSFMYFLQPQVKKRKLDGALPESGVEISGSKVYCLPHGSVTSNPHIQEIVTMVKPHILELIEHTNKVGTR